MTSLGGMYTFMAYLKTVEEAHIIYRQKTRYSKWNELHTK